MFTKDASEEFDRHITTLFKYIFIKAILLSWSTHTCSKLLKYRARPKKENITRNASLSLPPCWDKNPPPPSSKKNYILNELAHTISLQGIYRRPVTLIKSQISYYCTWYIVFKFWIKLIYIADNDCRVVSYPDVFVHCIAIHLKCEDTERVWIPKSL